MSEGVYSKLGTEGINSISDLGIDENYDAMINFFLISLPTNQMSTHSFSFSPTVLCPLVLFFLIACRMA